MNPGDVPEDLVDAADLALSDACTESTGEKCTCFDDRQIRTILAAVIPRVLERAADAVEAEAIGPGHDLGAMDAGIFHAALFLRRAARPDAVKIAASYYDDGHQALLDLQREAAGDQDEPDPSWDEPPF